MKNIKTFIIGFLSCACLFLLIGAGGGNTNGRFQSFGWAESNIGMVDTRTGDLFNWVNSKGTWKWKKRTTPGQLFKRNKK